MVGVGQCGVREGRGDAALFDLCVADEMMIDVAPQPNPTCGFLLEIKFCWEFRLLYAFLNQSQCQECPRSVLSGMCPVCTHLGYPPSPLNLWNHRVSTKFTAKSAGHRT